MEISLKKNESIKAHLLLEEVSVNTYLSTWDTSEAKFKGYEPIILEKNTTQLRWTYKGNQTLHYKVWGFCITRDGKVVHASGIKGGTRPLLLNKGFTINISDINITF